MCVGTCTDSVEQTMGDVLQKVMTVGQMQKAGFQSAQHWDHNCIVCRLLSIMAQNDDVGCCRLVGVMHSANCWVSTTTDGQVSQKAMCDCSLCWIVAFLDGSTDKKLTQTLVQSSCVYKVL
jgi:hypothetical protein